MPVDFLTPESATLAGLIAAALYAFWRRIRTDTFSDRTASREDVFRDDLIKLNKDLSERCDRFAHERNEALAELADWKARAGLREERLSRARQACSSPGACGLDSQE